MEISNENYEKLHAICMDLQKDITNKKYNFSDEIDIEKFEEKMNEYLKTNLKTKGICVEFKEVNDQTILKGLIKPYPFPVVFDIHLDNKNIPEQGADN